MSAIMIEGIAPRPSHPYEADFLVSSAMASDDPFDSIPMGPTDPRFEKYPTLKHTTLNAIERFNSTGIYVNRVELVETTTRAGKPQVYSLLYIIGNLDGAILGEIRNSAKRDKLTVRYARNQSYKLHTTFRVWAGRESSK